MKKISIFFVSILMISVFCTISVFAGPKYDSKSEGKTQKANVGDTGTGTNPTESTKKTGTGTDGDTDSGNKALKVFQENKPDISDYEDKVEEDDMSPTKLYGYFWYIYDLNDKSTETKPTLITDGSLFENTFNEVGDYRVEKYTVKLRYDYTKFSTYSPYIKRYVDFEDKDANGEYRVKKISYTVMWRLTSVKDMPNSRSKHKPVTKTLYASNGAKLGTVSGGNEYMQLDNNGGGSDGPRIYRDVVISGPSKWTVHVTDPPETWREGDGSTKVGGPEVDVELIK